MKLLKNITKIFICIGMLSLFVMPSSISANSLQDPDNDGIPGTEGVDYFIVHSEIIPEEKIENFEIMPRIAAGYSIRNVRNSGGGTKPFGTTKTGVPGQLITYNESASTSMRAATSTGISIKDVSAVLGFNVSPSYSKHLSYSYSVPKTYAGKAVKYGTIQPRLSYDAYYYEFYHNNSKTGYGYADKPKTVDFVISYVYK